MRDASLYDGMTSRKDDYEVIEDDGGFGVRNITQDKTFPPRWSKYKYALKWKFLLKRFRWNPVQRKRHSILMMASTRPKAGISAADFARDWYYPILKDCRDPEMSSEDFHEKCVKRARTQLRKYAREGLVRFEPKGERDRWFMAALGESWLIEVNIYLEVAKPPELKKG